MIDLLIAPAATKLASLPFFDRYAGLVTPFERVNEDGTKSTIPLSCDSILQGCRNSPYSIITPDDSFKSLFYFEAVEPVDLNYSGRGLIEIDTSVNLVAWFNNKKLGVNPYCTGAAVMSVHLQKAMNFRNNVTSQQLSYRVVSDISATYNPFEKYDNDFLPAMLDPYFYVVLRMEIKGAMGLSCVDPFTPVFTC